MSFMPLPKGHPAQLPIPPVFMPQNPLGAILGGLAPKPQYQPQVPQIFGGGPQPGSVPMPTGEPMPTSPQQAAQGKWAKLWQAMNSPQGQAYLMGAGLNIMNRPREGESPLQHIVNGLTTGGLGTVYAMQAMQRQRAMEDKKAQLEERKVAADEQQVKNQGTYQQGSLKNEQARIDVTKWSAEQEAKYRGLSLEQQAAELTFQKDKLRQEMALANRRAGTEETKVKGDLANDAERNRIQNAMLGIQRMEAVARQKQVEYLYGGGSDDFKYYKLAQERALKRLAAAKDALFMEADPIVASDKFYQQALREELSNVKMEAGKVGTLSTPTAQTTSQATPQQSSSAPAVGTVQQGYRFKGGNPADANSWEKVN